MSAETIPVVDLCPYFDGTPDGKRAVGRAVDAACRSLGFLVVSGHRVAPELIETIRSISFAYLDLPVAEKMALRMPPDRYRGYTPMLAENLAASLGEEAPPDLKESFSIGPVDTPNDAYHTGPAAGTFFAGESLARPTGRDARCLHPLLPRDGGSRHPPDAHLRARSRSAGDLFRRQG